MTTKREDKHFNRCPNPDCKSEERVAEELLKESKVLGMAPDNLKCPILHIDIMPIVQGDPNVPIGIKFSSAFVDIDGCAECGTLYITDVMYGVTEIKKVPQLYGPSGIPMGPQGMANPSVN